MCCWLKMKTVSRFSSQQRLNEMDINRVEKKRKQTNIKQKGTKKVNFLSSQWGQPQFCHDGNNGVRTPVDSKLFEVLLYYFWRTLHRERCLFYIMILLHFLSQGGGRSKKNTLKLRQRFINYALLHHTMSKQQPVYYQSTFNQRIQVCF